MTAELAARTEDLGSASEADLDVLERQMEWQELLAPDELGDCVPIDTGGDWTAVEARCRSIAAELHSSDR